MKYMFKINNNPFLNLPQQLFDTFYINILVYRMDAMIHVHHNSVNCAKYALVLN